MICLFQQLKEVKKTKDRIHELRKALKMTQEDFGNKIGVARNTIANYECGRRIPTNAVINSICIIFNVNEEWLKNGFGEMFKEIPEEDETAALLSELLEDNGKTPTYELIKGIIRTYQQLDPKSQNILNGIIEKSFENMKKEEN